MIASNNETTYDQVLNQALAALPPMPPSPMPSAAPAVPTVSETPKVPTFEEALFAIPAGVSKIPALPILLFEQYAEIDLGNGVKKHISHTSLKEMIDRSLNTQETAVDIKGMMLPSNVFFFSQTKNKIFFNTYYPGSNRQMLYGEKKMEIAAPNIVISFTLRKDGEDWIMESTFYMCTDLPLNKLPKQFINGPNPSQGLYLLPMSNTYDDGRMCYGGNSMPARFKDNNFRGIDWYFRYLWETPFNNDLGIRAIGDRIGVGNWYALLERLAKANKTFPYKDLRNWKQIDGAVPSTSEV